MNSRRLPEGFDDAGLEVISEAYQRRQDPLVAQIIELRATTLAGHRARASALEAWIANDPSDDLEGKLPMALLGDLTA